MTKLPRTAKGRRAGKLTEAPVPPVIARLPGRHRAYRTASGCGVSVSQEPAKRAPAGIWLPPNELTLWHLVVSHPHRYPTWDEIADVRYELVPDDVTMAMLLPPPDSYVNLHEFAFQLWQIDDRRTAAARS